MDHFDFDGGAIDDQCSSAAIWEWQGQVDYYGRLHKDDFLPDPCSSFWDIQYQFSDIQADPSLCAEASMFHQQTPIKHCANLEYQFSDIADIIAKDFEEWSETSQAKRRRTLQFSPENVEMTRHMTEGGLSQSLQVMDSSGTSSLLMPDETNELLEESLINCLQDVEAYFPAEEMNTHVASMEKAVDISAEPSKARPEMLKASKNIVTRKEPTYVAYPFDSIMSASIHGGVTIKDINEMLYKPPHKNNEEPNSFQASAISEKPGVLKRKIRAPPPHKIKHLNDKETNSSQASAISGKPVVCKRTIHTKGGDGTITIIRTIGEADHL